MSTTKTRAPYRHTDGTNCYTKNCSLGHSTGMATAQKELDSAQSLDSYFEAKAKVKKASQLLTVNQLQDKLKEDYPGLRLWLNGNETNISLDTIVVPKELRNTGVGTKVMRELIEYADKNQKTISLTPSSDLGSSKARLEVFYRRLGFTTNRGSRRDFTIMDTMIRYPA